MKKAKVVNNIGETLWTKEEAAAYFREPLSSFNLLFSQGEYDGCYFRQGRKVKFVPELCRTLAKKRCGKAS